MTQISVYGNYHVRKKSDRTYAPSNQLFYGPYVAETDQKGIDLAWAEMSEVFTGATEATTPPIGWTFGVQNSTTGVITEYWLTGGHTKDCIVKKGGSDSTYTAGDGISSSQLDNGVIAVDLATDDFVEDLVDSLGEDNTTPETSEEGLRYKYTAELPKGVLNINVILDTTNKKAKVLIFNTSSNSITSGDIVGTIIKKIEDSGETSMSTAMTGNGSGGVTTEISFTGDVSKFSLLLQINTEYSYEVLTTAINYISLSVPTSNS